jgi:hypothetical protein
MFRNGEEGDNRIPTFGKCLGNKHFAGKPFCLGGGLLNGLHYIICCIILLPELYLNTCICV